MSVNLLHCCLFLSLLHMALAKYNIELIGGNVRNGGKRFRLMRSTSVPYSVEAGNRDCGRFLKGGRLANINDEATFDKIAKLVNKETDSTTVLLGMTYKKKNDRVYLGNGKRAKFARWLLDPVGDGPIGIVSNGYMKGYIVLPPDTGFIVAVCEY